MILDAAALFESDRLEQCSTQADLAYPRLLATADDWGRHEWNPRKIHSRAFPKRLGVREGDVKRWLLEYDQVRSHKDPTGPGLLTRYVVEGIEYFEWWAWKGVPPSRRKYMRCPPPPWADPSEVVIWEASRHHQTARRRARSRVDILTRSVPPLYPRSTQSVHTASEIFAASQGLLGQSETSQELENSKEPSLSIPGTRTGTRTGTLSVPAVPAVTATPPKAPPSDEGGAREDDPFELPPPPDPTGTNGHGSLAGSGLRRAVERVVRAEVDAGRLVDERARKGIRKQLRSGIPEDAVLDAFRRQAQTEGDMQRGAQRALDWIEAGGGAEAVAAQAVRWALDHREGPGDHRVYTRWLAQEAAPQFVLGFIGHALSVKERANPPPHSVQEEPRRP